MQGRNDWNEKDNLKTVPEHCWNLAECFSGYAGARYISVTEWLQIASGLARIDFNSARYDESLFMCGRAAEYEEARTAILAPLILEMARFSFIWGALESLLDILKLPKFKRSQSDVDAACDYLKREYEPLPFPVLYLDLLADLRYRFVNSGEYGALGAEFNLQEHIGRSGVGLHIVRKIRNRLAHGAFAFPAPEGWGGEKGIDEEVLTTCSRLVLLSLQMLVGAAEKQRSENVEISEEGETKEIGLLTYLRIAHINSQGADLGQESLRFEI